MKMKIVYFSVLGLLYSIQAMAAVPVTFSANTAARAADVNANFTDLDSRATANATAIAANAAAIAANKTAITTNTSGIAANATAITTNTSGIATNATAITANTTAIANIPGVTLYNYNDYTMASTITNKTFTLTGNFCTSTAVTETRDFTRPTSTSIVMTRKWLLSDTSVCSWKDFKYQFSTTQKTLVGENKYTTAGVLTASDALMVPMVVATSTMAKGVSFGSGTTVDTTPAGGSAALSGIFVQTKMALGTEDVTVPAGTYTGCLKTSTIRSSDAYGNFQQVSWSCPNVGEVKRIQMSTTAGYRIWELSSVTP